MQPLDSSGKPHGIDVASERRGNTGVSQILGDIETNCFCIICRDQVPHLRLRRLAGNLRRRR
jgi:hypothetical protein